MKRSKRTNSAKSSRPKLFPPKLDSARDLHRLQKRMADAIMRPLTAKAGMQGKWTDGRPMSEVVEGFIKPNQHLSSFERLELYNRQYWFRLLDCIHDDYPGLRAVLGLKKFNALSEAYLSRYPSRSFTLRNLGGRLVKFMLNQPRWIRPREKMAVDMARFEWAQVEAFDNEALPVLDADDLLGRDASKLRLCLQPYVRLLELDHAVDEFLLTFKRTEDFRAEASNAVEAIRKTGRARSSGTRPLPKRKKIFLAVHRLDHDLYYKRLDPEAFHILTGLGRGLSLEAACAKALRKNFDNNVNWPAKIQTWFKEWMALGWFVKERQK